MGIIEAVALGILQGLTEFLPVSSSGHLSLCQYFLGLAETPRFFDVMLHVGTLAAVLVYYGPWLWRKGATPPADAEPANSSLHQFVLLMFYLGLATVPAAAAAVVFRPTELAPGQRLAEAQPTWTQRIGNMREYAPSRPRVVVSFLAATGLILAVGSRFQGGRIDFEGMNWRHVLIIGAAQAVSAMCPGISRSGITISVAMLIGLRAEWAVHFSLLMSIPAILGALVLKLRSVDPSWLAGNLTATFAATVVSAVVGWFCIRLLVGAVRRGRWWWFSIYLWTLAAVVGIVLFS